MRVWPVSTPSKSNRPSNLKKEYLTHYFPKTWKEIAKDKWNEWPESQQSESRHLLSSHSSRLGHAENKFYPVVKSSRPHTSLGFNSFKENPASIRDLDCLAEEIEDRTGSSEPSYVFGLNEVTDYVPPLTYVPELSAWVTNANTDYEIKTAAKVSQVMYRGNQTSRQRSRSMSPTRTRPFLGRAYTMDPDSMIAMPGTYYSQWNPLVTSPREGQSYYNMSPPADYYQMPMPELTMLPDPRPRRRHRRRASFSQGYVHDGSCFSYTKPLVTGHFIIHPDWVSERMTKKGPPARQFRPMGLRY
ncbi:uncharacterized protein LOC121377443 [Gigantopelta aegis]|uniref:uncharacterized protein LOC121377443 n=1 Tax=Gigantopelta aegis TaxID=1735272 RepID=UPI001B889CF9|nr:uncharacterized protein LOC121377443 [Gigantopelta aegis]